ncbi:MAG: alpha/beta hydrolase [Gammaproteobacteria bacterium]|nr:alpha/beta hydrolase [Gammaproteobacteria bacterium]
MSKIIIGIHGLANKPPENILKSWWELSIKEGLHKNLNQNISFDFDMVYWADVLYKNALHNEKAFAFDDLYNNEPYTEAKETQFSEHKDGFWDSIRGGAENLTGGSIDFIHKRLGMDKFTNWAIGKTLKDLAFYYSPTTCIPVDNNTSTTALARTVLQNKLKEKLILHKDHEILLIAHSMGTIISYDVLRDLGQDSQYKNAFQKIEFVTIGSPLGVSHVKTQIKLEREYAGDNRVRTPTIVSQWDNYADPKDIVSVDSHLSDDYEPNKSDVKVKDDIVLNQFSTVDEQTKEVNHNHHKSYGYLRTPEVSKRVRDFLNS